MDVMTHRMIDPRISNICIDAHIFDHKGSANDALVDRLLALWDLDKINLIVPHSVLEEINHRNTPAPVKRIAAEQIRSLSTSLTPQELAQRDAIRKILQGNATAGKHDRDAQHIFEASKYASYFVTNDDRCIRKRDELSAHSGARIVTLEEFLEIFDRFEGRVAGPS